MNGVFLRKCFLGIASALAIDVLLFGAAPEVDSVSSRPQPVAESASFSNGISPHTDPVFPRMNAWFHSGPKWAPFAEFNFSSGNAEVLGDGLAFVPLWQDESRLFFADVRGLHTDKPATEANWGLGFRSLDDNGWIIGGYGFFDRRWEDPGLQFDQITLGAELMSYDWDFRINGYIPTSGQQLASSPSTAFYNGSTIMLATPGGVAASGVDLEVGRLLANWGENSNYEVRGFLGAYHFDNEDGGIDAFTGPRARLELRSYEVPGLPDGSRLTANINYQWDQVREEQFTAGIALRIPLRSWGSRRLSPLERRMVDRVVRDRDIVTQQNEFTEPARYADTGELVGDVEVYDTGSTDLASQLAGSSRDVVILDGRGGTFVTTDTVVVEEGHTLRGAGFEVMGATSSRTALFGQRAAVDASGVTAVDSIQLNDNTTLRDIDLAAGSQIGVGCAGDDLSGVLIDGVHVDGAGQVGFAFTDFAGVIRNSSALNSYDDGFQIQTLYGIMQNNVASSNGDDGISISEIAEGSSVIGNVAAGNAEDGYVIGYMGRGSRFEDNESSGNGERGFYVESVGREASVARNLAMGNNNEGFYVESIAGDSYVSGNQALSNSGNGFYVDDSRGYVVGNTAMGNGGHGLYLENITGVVSENNSSGNGGSGFNADDVEEFAVFEENVAKDNVSNGFRFYDVYGFAVVSNNYANGNGEHGFLFDDDLEGNSLVSGNVSEGNVGSGFVFDEDIGYYASIINNTSKYNGVHGVCVEYIGEGALFSGNASIGNGSDGYYIERIGGEAVVSGNTAEDNVANGFSVEEIVHDAMLVGNVSSGNSGHGFSVYEEVINMGVVSGNYAVSNGGTGFVFWDGVGNDARIEGNMSMENGNGGYDISLMRGSVVFSGNSSVNNNTYGYYVDSIVESSMFVDNYASGNGVFGYGVDVLRGGASVSGNESSDNGTYGFYVNQIIESSVFRGNVAAGNEFSGFVLTTIASGASATDNQSLRNGSVFTADGFQITTIDGTFSGNNAEDNSGMGYNVVNPGTATGNTGSGNAGGNNTLNYSLAP
ncbi:right-handed parallel beta-helix repeat-containing protein [Bremerella sp. JC770]|uniref:right-handed parallel beta-helix repeat-containing protein n=1 Tax=Bremerella sp. JC770 TaxID=3232137 RepID=UPI003458C4E5